MKAIRTSLLASLAAALFSVTPASASNFLDGAVAGFDDNWSVSDGSDPETVATKSGSGDTLTLAFDLGDDQTLTYTAPTASDANGTADVVISNAVFTTAFEHPGVEAVGGIDSQAAICVYTNTTSGGPLQYYGWAGAYTVENDVTNLTWNALTGATPVEGATNTVTMSFDYTASPATVTFKVGDTTLTPSGITLSTSKTQVTGVSFSGTGSIGEMAAASEPPAPSEFLVSFFDEGAASACWTTSVVANTAPAYAGPAMSKQPTAQYTYEFAGWTNAASANAVVTLANETIVSVTNYYATYTPTLRSYAIVFNNHDDTQLQSSSVSYGTEPTYSGSAPTKDETEQYTYTWTGWTDGENTYAKDAALPTVTGAKTYTATFAPVEKTFTVTWKNYDGTVLETDENVAYNATPSYNGADPTKSDGGQNTYTWTGWDPSPAAVTADVTYTATFSSTPNTYDITFYTNDVATVSWVTNVPYGTVPQYLAPAPTKAADAQYTWFFAGFTNTVATVPTNLFDAVTADVSYYAAFTNTVNTYTVTFVDENGTTVLDTQTLAYGSPVAYAGANAPSKASSDEFDYTWTGWTSGGNNYGTTDTLPTVEGDATYTATYSSDTRTYTVTWVVNGVTVETDANVPYGTTPTFDGTTPTKAATAQYTYGFTGWSPTVGNIEGDTEYVAQFSETLNTYTVTWVVNGVTVETDENVAYGTTPTYDGETPTKAATAQYTYGFTGWSPAVGAIEGNTQYVAQFSETLNTYTVTWQNYDGTTLETDQNVAYGTTPTYDGETPTKPATTEKTFSFTGWLPAVGAISGDTEYVAQFSESPRKYTVLFVTENNETVSSAQYDYGTLAADIAVPAAPAKTSTAQYDYTFAGWGTIADVTGDATYTASYTPVLRSYTITWKNGDATLDTDTVAYGVMPEYEGETPTKDADAQYTYTFSGWSPEVASVSGEATYTAQFTPVARPTLALLKPTLSSTALANAQSGAVVRATIDPAATVTGASATAGVSVDVDGATATFTSLPWNEAVDWTLSAEGASAALPGRFYAKGEAEWFNVATNEFDTVTDLAEGMKGVDMSADPSAAGQMVRIQTCLEIGEGGMEELPDSTGVGDARTGFAVAKLSGDEAAAFYAFNGSTWDKLLGATPVANTTNDLLIVLDVEAATARYYVEGIALYKDNAGTPVYAIPMKTFEADETKQINGIGFANADGVMSPVVAEYDVPFEAAIGDVPYATADAGVAAVAKDGTQTLALLTNGYAGTITLAAGQSVKVDTAKGSFAEAAPVVTSAGDGYEVVSSVAGSVTTYTVGLVEYPITYELNGGAYSGDNTNRLAYTAETPDFTLNNPSKDHYTFLGWTGTGIAGTNQTVTVALGSTGPRAYTSNWEIVSYTITWSYKNASGETVTSTHDFPYGTLAADVAAAAPTLVDYVVGDYKYVNGTFGTYTDVDGAKTYTATYTETLNTVTVSFVDYDATPIDSDEYTVGDSIVVPDDPVRASDAEHVYTFLGWSTDGTAENIVDLTGATATATVTYTAVYNAVAPAAMVISVADAETGATTTNYVATLADAFGANGAKNGDTVELLANVTLTERVEPNVGANTAITIDLGGYTITREGTSGNGSVFDVKSGDVTITNGVIVCTQDDTAIAKDGVYAITSRSGSNVTLADLAVTVNSECGACAYPFSGSTMTIESGTYANVTTTPYRYNTAITGMAVNQPNDATQNLFIKGGSFSQYDPQLGDDSGAMTDFTDDGFVAIQDGNGNWVVQPGYNVTFDANGGSPAPAAQRVAAGGTATAPTAPTKEHYSFRAWQTNGVDWVFADAVTSDMTLVADWAIDQFDVIWVADGAMVASNRVDYGTVTSSIQPVDPTKTGDAGSVYTFTGWSPVVAATVTQDATYTAQFSSICLVPASLELYPNCSNYVHVVGAPEGSTYTYKFAGQVGCDSYALNPPGWSKTEGWAWPYGKQPGGTGTITVTVSNNNAQVAQFVANVTVKDVAAVVDGVEYASADFANALAAAKSGDKVLEMYYYMSSYGKVALAEGESIRWKPADNRGKGSFWTSAATIPATTDAAWYKAVASKDDETGITTITCVNQGVPYVKIDDGTTVTYSTESFTSMSKAGTTYTLLRDMTDQTGGVVSKAGVILDLNGKKLGLATGIKVAVNSAASLTIRDTSQAGTGEISGGNDSSPLVWVTGGGTATIESGTFVSDGTTAVYTENGTASITGGTFSTTAADKTFLLNCKDSNKETITVTGGSFQGFNPQNNTADGEGTDYVASGYYAFPNDPSSGWYTVAEKKSVIGTTITVADAEYDGTAKEPAPTVVSGETTLTVADDYVVAYSSNTNAGNAMVTITGVNGWKDFTNVTFAITQKPATFTAASDTKTYDGQPLVKDAFTPSGLLSGHTATATVAGAQTNVGASSNVVSAAVVKDVNDVDVTANYAFTYVDGELEVTPAAAVVTADNNSKVYGADDPESFTATVTGLVGSDTLVYTVSRAEGENVGTYTITPAGDAVQGNYTVTYETGTFAITSAKVAVPTAVAGLVYNENLQTGVVENVGYTLTGNTATDAGSYTATATLAANYEWDADPATGTKTIGWSIAKAPLSDLAVALQGWTENDPANTPSVTGNAGGGTATITYWSKDGETQLSGQPTAAGTYTVKVEVAETANYLSGSATSTFTIDEIGTFTIIWLAEDGTKIAEEPVEANTSPSRTPPEKSDATGKYDYEFAGWQDTTSGFVYPAALPAATAAATYKATYTQTIATKLALPLADHAVDATVNGLAATVALAPTGTIAGVTYTAAPAAAWSDATTSFSFEGLDWNAGTNWTVDAAQGADALAETAHNEGVFYAKASVELFSASPNDFEEFDDLGIAGVGYSNEVASAEGEAVRVHTTIDVPDGGLESEPEVGGAKAGFAVLQLTGDAKPAFYAYNAGSNGAGTWTKLFGVEPKAGEADYLAVYDFAATTPAVRYYIDGVPLYAEGEGDTKVYAIPLAGMTSLSTVAFGDAAMVKDDVVAVQDVSYVAAVGETPYTNIVEALAAVTAADKAEANEVTLSLLKANLDPGATTVALAAGEAVTVDATSGSFAGDAPFVAADAPTYKVVTTGTAPVLTYKVELNLATVIWLAEDGATEVWRTNAVIGTVPVYEGPDQAKDATDAALYTFSGWTNAAGVAYAPTDTFPAVAIGGTNYTATFKTWTKVALPQVASGLVYTGEPQTGVTVGSGATLSGAAVGTAAVAYTATATLADAENTVWADDTAAPTANADRILNWSIAPKSLTLTWGATSFVADGTAKVPTATLDGVVEGDDVTAEVSGAQTAAGTYTATATLSGADAANYALPADPTTTFEIIAANAMTISVADTDTGATTTNYFATVQAAVDAAADAEPAVESVVLLADATETVVVSNAVALVLDGKTLTGDVTNTVAATISGGTVTGDLVADGAALSIAGGTYQGVLSTNGAGSISITGGHFVNDPTAFVADGYYAAAGDPDGYDVLAQNSILETTITVATDLEYDGTGKAGVTGVSFGGTDLVPDTDYTVEYTANTNAGVNTASAKITGIGAWKDYTNVTFSIAQRSATFTAESASKVYDGQPLSTNDFAVAGLVAGHTATATVAGSQTDVGVSSNVVSAVSIVDGDSNDVTANYAINYVDGELEVTKAAITITVAGTGSTATYTGAEQTGTVAYTLASNDALYDESKVVFSGDATVSGTNVGDYPYGLADADFSYNDANIDATFQVTDADFSITAATATIPTAVANLVYDGTEQTGVPEGTGYTIEGNKATNAGEYTATLTLAANYKWSDDTTDATKTVAWSIAKKAATITVANASKKYGEADPAFTGTVSVLVAEGDLGTVTYGRTNDTEAVGVYAGVIVPTYKANANYDVTVTPGTFTIEENKITIIWVVDGNETTNKVEWGDLPAFAGSTEKTDSTGKYAYEFTGWSPEVTNATVQAIYTAGYATTIGTPLALALDDPKLSSTAVSAAAKTATVAADLIGAVEGVQVAAEGATVAVSGDTATASFSGLAWNQGVEWKMSATQTAEDDAKTAESAELPGKFYVKPETAWFTATKEELLPVADTSEAAVGYTPAAASPEGEMVRVHTMVNVPAGGLPQAPETGDSKTGFAVLQLDGDAAPAFYAFGNGTWTKLAGVEPEQGEADFYAVYDLGAETPTARYYIDGVALYAEGDGGAKTYALPLASGTTSLKGISFASADMVAGSVEAEYDTSYVAAVDQTPYTEISDALAAAGTAGAKTLALLKAGVPLDPAVSLGSGEKLVVDYANGTFTNDVPVVSGVTGYDVKVTAADTVKTYELDPIVYQIAYVLDGGVNAASNTNEYTVATLPVALADATRTGYTFGGWTNNLSANAVVASIPVGTTGAVTNVATWTINNYLLTVNYLYTNGTVAATQFTSNVVYDTAYSVDSPVVQGYTADQLVVSGTMGAEPVTVDVTYRVNRYAVTFVDEDGTTLKAATEYDYGTLAADIAKPEDPTKAATADWVFTFAGWSPALADVTAEATYTATYTSNATVAAVITIADNGDGTATTNTAYVASLADAIAAANDGDTVQLLADVSEPAVALEDDITLDLNGNDWTVVAGEGEDEPGAVQIGAAVTITDSTAEGAAGTIVGDLAVTADGALTVDGGTVTGDVTATGGDVTVADGTVDGDVTATGDGAIVAVTGGAVTGGVAVSNGADATVSAGSVADGIAATGEGSTVAVSGGSVSDGVTATGAGSEATVTGGEIAGGVTIADGATGTVSGDDTVVNGTLTGTEETLVIDGGHFDNDPSAYVKEGYVAVADTPSGYKVQPGKSVIGTTITVAGGTYNGQAYEIGSVVLGDYTLTASDFTVVYTNVIDGVATNDNVNAGTVTATITGIGEWIDTTNVTFAITKAPLTITADDITVPLHTPADAVPYTFSYSGFVNGETNTVLSAQPTATTESPVYTASTEKGTTSTIVPSGAAAANYYIAYVNGTLTVGDAEAPTMLETTAITVAGTDVTLLHKIQSDAAYHTFFTCTDLKTGAWVAAENSRATADIETVEVEDAEGVKYAAGTVTFHNVTDNVRFYQIGYSSLPYTAGETMGEKPADAGDEEP